MSQQTETRRVGGVTEIKIHRINGESAWTDSVSAREAVNNHPDEWSFVPFSAAAQKEAQRDMPIDPSYVSDWRERGGYLQA